MTCELCRGFDAAPPLARCLACQEEEDALVFEFQLLQAQKADPAVKWTPGKQKRFERLAQSVKKVISQKALFEEGKTC